MAFEEEFGQKYQIVKLKILTVVMQLNLLRAKQVKIFNFDYGS